MIRKPKTTRDLLLAAAKKLNAPEKWCKVHYRNGPAMCMVAALREVSVKEGDLNKAYSSVLNVIGCGSVVEFNDSHCKTYKDAVAALKIAADLATPSPKRKVLK